MDFLIKYKGKDPFLLEVPFNLIRVHYFFNNELDLGVTFKLKFKFKLVFLKCFSFKVSLNLRATFSI